MKRIYNILACLMAALLLVFMPQDLSAKKAKKGGKKGKKAETEQVDTVKKKTPYEKFVTKKGTQKTEGFVTVYKAGDDIWLEIPESLIGRRLIQSSILEKSASVELGTGMEVSSNNIYQIARTDSLILLQTPATEFNVVDGDQGIEAALKSSLAQQTLFALPIKYRNADSTAYVVKANALFDMSKKAVANFAGYDYGNLKIEKNSYKKEFSRIIGVDCFENTIGVRNEATFELSLYIPGFGFQSTEKPTLTTQILTSFTLMPEKKVAQREVDSRVGVRQVTNLVYKAAGGIEEKKIASRWDLSDGEGITIYVDTLIGPSWTDAIRKGIQAWNVAFEKIGYGDVVKVLPYPADDPSFRVDNPLVSVVTFAGGTGMNVSAKILTDTSTGEIMSVRMSVPGDFVTGVRRAAVYSISDVDPRYQSYILSDDAVCEVLSAKVMSLFGRCLGLDRNYAGSAAYSPAQLSDVDFTQKKGITASVTDEVLFNTFAKPGDKERGLVTIIDRIGAYDEYAIEWLYGHEGENSKEELKKLVDSRQGNPEYFYAPSVKGRVSDPRIAKEALGNDPFAEYEASMRHLKFVAEHAHEWLMDDDIPQTYTDLFIDWLWLGMNTTAFRLTSYIGGMYANEVTEDSTQPMFVAVPEDVQRKCLKLVFDSFSDLSWIDANKELIQMPGANKDVSRFTNINLFTMADVKMRLMHVAMSGELAGSTYTVEEYLDDVEKFIFKDIRKGKIIPAGDVIATHYIAMLMNFSPVMAQNYKDFAEGGTKSLAANEFRVSVSGIPVGYVEELDKYAYRYMQRAENLLKQGRSAAGNDYDRKRLSYLISFVEAILGK